MTRTWRSRGERRRDWIVVAWALLLPAVAACRASPAGPSTGAAGPPYAPGLGEIMTLQQMRHVKLWLAGRAENWELARYEVEELGEGFDDVVKYHPTHKDAPIAPKDAVPRMVLGPLAEVRAAIDKRDEAAFVRSYDGLTAACNDCHKALDFGFNVIKRPESDPYPDQMFQVAH
jgi:hypothetical protein